METCWPNTSIWGQREMAGIECPAIPIGSWTDGSHGFPLHRMVLGGTSESVTWLVVSFFCCNFNPRYWSTTAAFCRNPRYCMTWQAPAMGGSSHHRPFSCGHECHKTREHVPVGPTLTKSSCFQICLCAGLVIGIPFWHHESATGMCYASQALA